MQMKYESFHGTQNEIIRLFAKIEDGIRNYFC